MNIKKHTQIKFPKNFQRDTKKHNKDRVEERTI